MEQAFSGYRPQASWCDLMASILSFGAGKSGPENHPRSSITSPQTKQEISGYPA
jgi:hypothetical protein